MVVLPDSPFPNVACNFIHTLTSLLSFFSLSSLSLSSFSKTSVSSIFLLLLSSSALSGKSGKRLHFCSSHVGGDETSFPTVLPIEQHESSGRLLSLTLLLPFLFSFSFSFFLFFFSFEIAEDRGRREISLLPPSFRIFKSYETTKPARTTALWHKVLLWRRKRDTQGA